MSSSRLPGKVLANIAGKTMLERVVERVRSIKNIDDVVVATTTDINDDPIVNEATRLGVEAFKGHPTDVLDRYFEAANTHNAEVIVRVTADCPLLDPHVAENVIERFLQTKVDYCSNIRPPTYPDGLDVEVLTAQALEISWHDAKLESDREHVTTYIRRTNPDRFTKSNVEHHVDLSSMRWTIDEPQDLEFMRTLLPRLEDKHENATRLENVLEILRGYPDVAILNSSIIRNEGWNQSLANDHPN
jgi:spore coat polysaccharide biosynthesis protein SpsF (cytidylyltransferase family)